MKPTHNQSAALVGLVVALGVCLQTCADVQPAPVVIEEVAAPIESAQAADTDDTDKAAAVVTP